MTKFTISDELHALAQDKDLHLSLVSTTLCIYVAGKHNALLATYDLVTSGAYCLSGSSLPHQCRLPHIVVNDSDLRRLVNYLHNQIRILRRTQA